MGIFHVFWLYKQYQIVQSITFTLKVLVLQKYALLGIDSMKLSFQPRNRFPKKLEENLL